MKERTYRPLTRNVRSGTAVLHVVRQRLWLAADHLLLTSNLGFTESYKRFYMPDIQAIVLTRTKAGFIGNILLGFFALDMFAFALGGFLFEWPPAATITFAALGGILALFLLVNWLRGPTCRCHVRTAVQTERVYALNRLHKARRIVESLRGTIEEEQGTLTPGHLEDAAARPPRAPSPAARARRVRPVAVPRIVRPYGGHAHDVLVGVLLVDFSHSCLRFLTGGILMLTASLLIGLSLAVSVTVALGRQSGTNLPRALKRMTWICLGYIVISYMFGFIHSIVLSISDPAIAGNSREAMLAAASMTPFDSPVFLVMFLFSIGCAGTLGFTGLTMLARFRAQGHASSPAGGADRQSPPAA
ncbi:MAG: hypothetical protein HQ559_05760 [Lentisphaerae bacterium]|nr:hypothetical protein [Lentisphaerota bacterium]